MNVYRVEKEFEFCTAHRLMKNLGKCFWLHGHNYRAIVTLEAPDLTADEMVVDFDTITTTIGAWIKQTWDHNTILNTDDRAIIAVLQSMNQPVVRLLGDPTAERLAEILFARAQEMLENDHVTVVQVQVFETRTCSGIYRAVAK